MLTDDSSEEKIKSRPRKNRFLQSLEHKKAVNSAYFSHVDGTRLLTTDQHSELRIYKGPFWDLERVLPHPHRQFQHLTPIKATWHPLVDLVVAGRYPDPNFPGFIEGKKYNFLEIRGFLCLMELFKFTRIHLVKGHIFVIFPY